MHNKYIPLATFGTLAFLTGALSLILPETTGVSLPETLEDAERLQVVIVDKHSRDE